MKNNDEFQKFLDGLFQEPMVVHNVEPLMQFTLFKLISKLKNNR